MPETEKNQNVADFFACNVFNQTIMRERLPKNIFKAVMQTKTFGTALDSTIADVVANAMKDCLLYIGGIIFCNFLFSFVFVYFYYNRNHLTKQLSRSILPISLQS